MTHDSSNNKITAKKSLHGLTGAEIFIFICYRLKGLLILYILHFSSHIFFMSVCAFSCWRWLKYEFCSVNTISAHNYMFKSQLMAPTQIWLLIFGHHPSKRNVCLLVPSKLASIVGYNGHHFTVVQLYSYIAVYRKLWM